MEAGRNLKPPNGANAQSASIQYVRIDHRGPYAAMVLDFGENRTMVVRIMVSGPETVQTMTLPAEPVAGAARLRSRSGFGTLLPPQRSSSSVDDRDEGR